MGRRRAEPSSRGPRPVPLAARRGAGPGRGGTRRPPARTAWRGPRHALPSARWQDGDGERHREGAAGVGGGPGRPRHRHGGTWSESGLSPARFAGAVVCPGRRLARGHRGCEAAGVTFSAASDFPLHVQRWRRRRRFAFRRRKQNYHRSARGAAPAFIALPLRSPQPRAAPPRARPAAWRPQRHLRAPRAEGGPRPWECRSFSL